MTVLVWVAFVLACFSFGLIVGAVLFSVRAWRRLAPTVAPLLSMFAPPAVGAEPAGGADSGRVVAPPAATVNGHVIGEHFQSCGIFDGRPCDCALQP